MPKIFNILTFYSHAKFVREPIELRQQDRLLQFLRRERDGSKIAQGTFVSMHDIETWCAYKGNPAEKLAVPSTKIRM